MQGLGYTWLVNVSVVTAWPFNAASELAYH
jgi:hypothetical protein